MSPVRRALWISAGAFVALVLAAAAAVAVYDHSRRDRIAPGITIGGVPVGRLTAAEAQAKVSAALREPLDRDVTVRAGGHRFTLPASQLHEHVDVDALVKGAVALSRRGSILTRTLHNLKATPVHAALPVTVEFSRRAVSRLAARVGDALDADPVNATVKPTASGLEKTPGRPGAMISEGSLRARLNAALAKLDGPRTVRARLRPVQPDVTTADLAKKYPAYIIIDRAHFTLRFYRDLKLDRTYPIAVGMQGLETPAGLYDIQWKQTNPSWYVPNSAWAGKLAGKVIPPGPDDPIKARWMAFNGGAGIHGIDPSEYGSIGHNASHGCVRMRIPDVIDLYEKTPVGTPVFIA